MKISPLVQPPTLEDSVHGDGVSDSEAQRSPYLLEDLGQPPITSKTMAYGNYGARDLAYGGNDLANINATTGSRIYRLERGYPKTRRGNLIAAVPRTKAETLYTKDTGQAMQNKVLSTGATGVGTSGIPSPGTTNKINTTTGALNRYRTPYKTNIQ